MQSVYVFGGISTKTITFLLKCQHRQYRHGNWYADTSQKNELITKTCLFKYTENFTTKNWKFSGKKFWYFSYFCSKT